MKQNHKIQGKNNRDIGFKRSSSKSFVVPPST